MRNLKKFLALVLVMVMAFSLMVTANAAHAGTQYGDEADVTPAFSEAVEVLTGMGVFQGDSGNFRPASNITRAEMAAIIYRLATGDTGTAKMDLYTTRHPFTDVRADAWYAGYVGYLYNAKIIKGMTATTFNPSGNVTGYEVLAMILRAVGYDKNDEFTGGTWTVEVASTATTLGILKDVDSTHYGDTLHLASRRDVVASMLFRTAAYVPMVQYTLAFGYQNTGMSGGVTGSTLNPTLGYRNFGLTGKTGIVVGNQATGEDYTKVGFGATGLWTGTVPALTDMEFNGSVSYNYATTGSMVLTEAAPNGNVTLEYRFNTGLDYFGHKVNVWYNGKSASSAQLFGGVVSVPSRFATYAVVDKANLVKTVFANNALLNANSATSSVINLLDAAQANGFSGANKNWTAAFMSDRYSQFSLTRQNADPIVSKVGMYKLISNGSTLDVDAVISLNQEVARINQVNTTVKDGEYIYLDSGNSRFGSQLAATANQGQIFYDQLSDASVKTLGTLVTAHEIVGTSKTALVGGLAAAADANREYTTANAVNTAQCWYQTDELKSGLTGTIATYTLADKTDLTSQVMRVVLTDNTILDLSGITGSNVSDADYVWNFDPAYSHLVNGLTPLTGRNTSAGVTYTFYFDEVGRFIGVSAPNDYKFLYTTFADYSIGNLGTGTIGYYVYGVDWNGEIVKDKQIVSITEPVDSTTTPTEPKFDDLTVNGALTTYPGLARTLAMGYNLLPVTLKDQGTSVVGNQIKAGANTRFVVDPAGNMNWYDVSNDYGERFLGWWDASANNGAGAASYTWTITAQDAANGFKRVYNHDVAITNPCTAIAAPVGTADNTDYLLTNSTKFIVVTGSGTADLAVKTYNGIADLVGSNSYAEISIKNDFKGDNVYFITSAQKYGNVNTELNHTIDTVILSNTNLNNFTTQSLFFSAPGNVATGVKLAGDVGTYGTVNQYRLFNNGELGYYWVSDSQSTGPDGAVGFGGDDSANGTAKKGDFYTLTPIGTVNGQPIYKATVQTPYALSGRICDVDQRYDYIMVNDLSTAAFGPAASNVVKKVGGANVTVALGDNYDATFVGLFPYGININDVQTLNNAVSMGKPGNSGNLYDIKVAFEYNGVEVTNIYVTAVTTTP